MAYEQGEDWTELVFLLCKHYILNGDIDSIMADNFHRDISEDAIKDREQTRQLLVRNIEQSNIFKAMHTEKLCTQERKEDFDSLVDRALASLGGRDNVYVDILYNLNRNGEKKSAKASASATETSKTVVVSSSSESADSSSSKTSRRKRKAEHEACVKHQDLKNTDTDLKHTGEHVIYDVHDDGTFSWRLDD